MGGRRLRSRIGGRKRRIGGGRGRGVRRKK